MILDVYCVDNALPFSNVKDCPASVNTGTSSTVPLNSNSKSPVLAKSCASVNVVLPSLVYKFTNCIGLFAVAEVFPCNCIPWVVSHDFTLDPVGSVAHVAAISIVPVPSDEIVAPPKSIVSEDKYTVCHLRELDPN